MNLFTLSESEMDVIAIFPQKDCIDRSNFNLNLFDSIQINSRLGLEALMP